MLILDLWTKLLKDLRLLMILLPSTWWKIIAGNYSSVVSIYWMGLIDNWLQQLLSLTSCLPPSFFDFKPRFVQLWKKATTKRNESEIDCVVNDFSFSQFILCLQFISNACLLLLLYSKMSGTASTAAFLATKKN